MKKTTNNLRVRRHLLRSWNNGNEYAQNSLVFLKKIPVIEFTSEKKTHRKVDYNSINEIIENAWKVLTSKGNISDALLIHIMYVLGLKIGEVRYLRFEDVYSKDRPITHMYNSQKNRKKKVIISQELYNEIKQYENELINEKKYFKSIR